MPISSVNGSNAATPSIAPAGGYASLGQRDFLRLLTTQLQQQDPTDPVDNKEMLAQMAQFSQLNGINDMASTLKAIAGKLDAVLAGQSATNIPAA
jgi:flagellar basal-body rod modification protein FlgD